MNPEYMQVAIDSAREGIQAGHGGPFGACVVKGDKVVGVGHNTVLRDSDPTCHGEVMAIRHACQTLGTHVLDGCHLYTTADPCPMCLSAIYWARIDAIFVGADMECAARHGFDDSVFREQVCLPAEKRSIPSQTGILEAECEKVFHEWRELNGILY